MNQPVLGVGRTVSATFTRPNDTNTYASGDVVNTSASAGTILTINAPASQARALCIIQEAVLVDSANQTLKGDFELWLFDTTVVADNDNAAFTPTDAELLTLVGVIDFPASAFKVGDATSGAGGNAVCRVSNLGIPFNTTGTNSLFGVVVVRNAYIPVANEVFTIRLKVLD